MKVEIPTFSIEKMRIRLKPSTKVAARAFTLSTRCNRFATLVPNGICSSVSDAMVQMRTVNAEIWCVIANSKCMVWTSVYS